MLALPELLIRLLIFPGLLFSFIVGGIFYWFYRKVRARSQARIGPPWYQYFVDVIKLFSKKSRITQPSIHYLSIITPIISISALILIVAILPIGNGPLMSFEGDLIIALYLLTLPGFAIGIAGLASKSPYGIIGSRREARIAASYGIPFVLSTLTVAFYTQSLTISSIVEYQLENGVFFLRYPLATIAFLLCLLPIMGRRPFDSPDADTEIIGGPLTEYSGTPLGLFELSNGIKWFVAPAFTVFLLFGGATNIIELLLKCLSLVIIVSIIDIIYTRYRTDQSFKFFLKWALPLVLIDLVRSLI
ncbi:respiratory chain complex I subunit 1 family protein [[Eubacterium] cellulosolvens]